MRRFQATPITCGAKSVLSTFVDGGLHILNEPDAMPPLAQRLEEARIFVGAKTLREFHTGLSELGVPGFPGYGAVQTYHSKPWRSPPFEYIQAIAQRYPNVSLAYLIGGVGNISAADVRAGGWAAIESMSLAELNKMLLEQKKAVEASFGTSFRYMTLKAVDHLATTRVLWEGGLDIGAEDWQRAAEALAQPLRTLDVEPTSVPPAILEYYVSSLVPLLDLVLTHTRREEKEMAPIERSRDVAYRKRPRPDADQEKEEPDAKEA